LQGFAALAALYVRQGKLDQARQRYESLGTKGASAVAAQTMVGLIYEAQNRPAEAKVAYEKLLATNPESAVAANNLAWRYAEDGGNLDVALQLAQTAKRGLPDSPEVNDTLGWIYLKKDLTNQAIASFQQAVQGSPARADYKYHLGMAYAKAGHRVKAAEEFDGAIKLRPDFKEAADARRALAIGS
jgi:tetratricopeptide (TPR) repeat protein